MEQTRLDQPRQGLARFAGRRDAVRSLGAIGTALLAALGLADAAAAGKPRRKGKKCGKCATGRRVPVVRAGNSDSGPGFINSQAFCNPGEHAMSGGYFLLNVDWATFVQMENVPIENDAGVPIGWSAGIETSGGNKSIGTRVLCVAH